MSSAISKNEWASVACTYSTDPGRTSWVSSPILS